MSDPWAEFTSQPAPAKSADPWAEFLPPEKPSVAADIAKSAGSGLVRGVTGLAGMVGDAADGLGRVSDWAAPNVVAGLNGFLGTSFDSSPLPARRNRVAEVIGSESINRAIDGATGTPITSYKPQTVAGEYARTIGEFAPGAIVPGGLAAKIGGGVLAPALLSETAGQATKGTSMEAPARLAGALAGGIGGALAARPRTAHEAVRAHMTNLTDDQVVAAGRLMEDAASRGVALTWPEAIAQTSGNSASLTSIQRVVEGSEKGGEVMRGFMSQRAGQVDAAGRSALAGIGELTTSPSAVGQGASQAARSAIAETPEGMRVGEAVWRAGPRTTAEDAGRIIQPDLARVHQGREGMRAALADADYGAARNAPATIPVGGDFGFRNVHTVRDAPEIPILLDSGAREAARAERMAITSQFERMPVLGLPPERMAQVDPAPIVNAIDGMLTTAKGTPARALEAARKALHRPDGVLDDTVAGLDASRKAITDLIDEAKRGGQNNTVRQLEEALTQLDRSLDAVPAYGRAKQNFEAASRPLAQFDEARAPGQIVQRDQYNRDLVLPPDRATRAIDAAGPQGARDLNAVASPQSREAYENYLTTQVLDRAGRTGLDVSPDAIRAALIENEDVLRQFPRVRDNLEAVIVAREGLARVEATPLGHIARRDTTTRQAVDALFPANPLPGSGREITQAVTALAAKSPTIARQLVRTHAETVFNAATRNLTGGPNEFGGAKFAALLAGNRQQAANLEAAVRALPDGAARWDGFRRFIDVMEATGQRQRIGSMTAFNREFMDNLSKGGVTAELATVAKSGGTALPAMIRQRYEQFQLGKNTAAIARLITDPQALPVLRALARENVGSVKAQAATLRLLAISQQGKVAAER